MDVCINNPFKAILRKCWVEHVSKAVEKIPTLTSNDYKLPPPSRQDMVDWVEKAYNIFYIFHCKFIRDFIFDTLFSVEKVN